MNTESFLSLRVFKKFFCVPFVIVKVFFSVFFHCTLIFNCKLLYIDLRVVENPYITVMTLMGFSTSAV